MLQTNKIGIQLADLVGVTAITDVTGFGLLGHLTELCEASNVNAELNFSKVPKIHGLDRYQNLGCTPGGTQRNFESYGHNISPISENQRQILCDPQTSGGLLIAVNPDIIEDFDAVCMKHDLRLESFGRLKKLSKFLINVV